MDPIRVGIIGVGWGSLVQAPAFGIVPDYEVVAICSRRPERVAEAAERLGIPETSTDWESFVRRDDLDLISVCTPTGLHHPQTIAALEAGRHVLCEKPLALDETEAASMVAAAESAGRANAVCFEGRWGAEKLPVWELVQQGYLGHPYLARVTVAADYWHPSRALQSEWMYRLDEGGGYLLGLASHDIDFLSCLLGEPVAVCADVRTAVPRRTRPDGTELVVDADDTSNLLLRMASGALAVISVTASALHTQSAYRLEAYGSDGSIRIDGSLFAGSVSAGQVGDEGLAAVDATPREPRSGRAIPDRRAGAAIRMMALMLEAWVPAFRGEPTPVPTLRDGQRVQRVVAAARRSSAGAGWVDL